MVDCPKCKEGDISKEYYLGADTGDYVCSNKKCGNNIGRTEYHRLIKERNERKDTS